MEIILMLSIFCGVLVLFCTFLLIALDKASYRIQDMNKKLMILAMGRERNVDGLRALVASERPSQGKLQGIATKKKDEDKSKNTNYTMQVGVSDVL